MQIMKFKKSLPKTLIAPHIFGDDRWIVHGQSLGNRC